MVDLWLDAAERNQGNDAGTMDGDGSRKLLLHDTEGSTIAGAVGAYSTHNSWPHLTVDCRRRRVQQHIAFNRAGRALRNQAGGVQTNREGTCLVQIEIVGFANNRDGTMFGSLADYDWFGREIVGPICRSLGIPLRSTVRWVSYPDSYGVGASQRLGGAAWDAYEGILGHQHCPENTHGDPGAIDITRILRAAGGSTTTVQEDDMDVSEFVNALNDGQPAAERVQKQADQGAGEAIARQASTDGSALRKALREISGAEAVTAVDNVLKVHAADPNSPLRNAIQAEVAEALTPVTDALEALRQAFEGPSS